MRTLVVGASGLVGGRLVQYLHEVGGVKIRAATRTARSWPNGVEGCVADIGAPETLAAPCQDVDVVINLASMPERASREDPVRALHVTAGGALGLATAAARAGVRRFVQMSTSKVYGNDPQGRVSEDTVTAARSHYAIAHRTSEDYALSQHPASVVLRLANGFGAPVDPAVDCWDIIANDFCRQAVTDRRIRVRSSGLAWRNFVPLSDVVRALHAAAVDLAPGLYNLGSPRSMTLRDLAGVVAGICRDTWGFTPELTFGPVAAGETHVPLDYRIDRLAAAGFAPGASIDAELRDTLSAAERRIGQGRDK